MKVLMKENKLICLLFLKYEDYIDNIVEALKMGSRWEGGAIQWSEEWGGMTWWRGGHRTVSPWTCSMGWLTPSPPNI